MTNSARFAACVPMSPMQPARPERFGSVRHDACMFSLPVSLKSQPCGYCTTTLRIFPRSPAFTMSRASFTIG